MTDGFTDETWAAAAVGASGARDPVMLTSQVKFMREGFEKAGHGRPALILLVVKDGEEDAAIARISDALNGVGRRHEPKHPDAVGNHE